MILGVLVAFGVGASKTRMALFGGLASATSDRNQYDGLIFELNTERPG
jgi:hypothetical protein